MNMNQSDVKQITISNIPELSAIYFALLQCGYDFHTIGRSQKHVTCIQGFLSEKNTFPFFDRVKQDTCEVYPYWPRAAILETASFYLLPDHSQFRDYDTFHKKIMVAGNIADCERDQKLWDWITDFPVALSKVLTSDIFQRYVEWEQKWLTEQNVRYEADLQLIKKYLDVCVAKYGSLVPDIRIVINPIKCIYSADYHLDGNCFIFSSGMFRADSVIHEFLHHIVHPIVMEIADMVMENKRIYPGIDKSYYLSGNDTGQLNAFEEYAVRELTMNVMGSNFSNNLVSYLRELI